MGTLPDIATIKPVMSTPSRMRIFLSALRYLVGKLITILVTIFLGVFITIVIMDAPEGVGGFLGLTPFEMRLEQEVYWVIETSINRDLILRDASGVPLESEVKDLEQKLRAEVGLDLPPIPRYMLWTYMALSFNWDELGTRYLPQSTPEAEIFPNPLTGLLLQYLPNTLLLVGTAYLLVFLIGMPFSLYLARHYGGWLDRVMSVLSPISSVPSWVFAMLLITVFAVQLRWLPVSGMFEFTKPTEPIPYVMELLRHMILPVLALVLSLLFQLVYAWRTFFIIYSEEDYVDLARAKGLNTRLLEKRYILRPALPYIITSFATSLIGFWQLTVALEKVFNWPGIGLLYLQVLPSFWRETVIIGDLMIVVHIVVTFSYLLGILAFLLDLTYVILDPRIHLIPSSAGAQSRTRVKTKHGPWKELFVRTQTKDPALVKPVRRVKKQAFSLDRSIHNVRESISSLRERTRLFAGHLRMYPSAIFGLTVIMLLLVGSLYTLIALPYEEIGMDYNQERVSGRNLAPRTAAPAWTNLFSAPPYLSTIIMDEKDTHASVTSETLDNGWIQKTVTFEFDYNYREIPSDVFLYFDSSYDEKIPFNSLEWITPDGRTIDLKAKAMGGETSYDMQTGTFVRRMLLENPEWKSWFAEDGQYPTPAYKLLFAKPGSEEPVPLRGTYQLRITSLLFEPDSDVNPQLAVLGQVYGLAGTDYWRRDLIVPLLWGMPFTLIVGFIGTFITTLVALLLPAIGVWFGGWLDTLIQRVSEVNMVLPGLAIAVLASALLGVHIWIILGIVVMLNAFGAPIKTFRSAFLQAKEAPYIDMARSYGASNFRIITRYLVPRILPVLIPYLVMQIPTFIFLEATLGFFNIRSIYPSWGRIIYEGLSRGALYGSPFWVLEPIFLLLLTGLAFAMLGLALERILNPRVISDIPSISGKVKTEAAREERSKQSRKRSSRNKRLRAAILPALVAIVIFVPTVQGKTLASIFIQYLDPSREVDTRIKSPPVTATGTPEPAPTASVTDTPVTPTDASPTSIPAKLPSSSPTVTEIPEVLELTHMPIQTERIETYTLQKGEYPYCIARRLNIDPNEFLNLNGLTNSQNFYTGMVLQVPVSNRQFPGEHRLQDHPTTYVVSTASETIYSVACAYGDVDPQAIAEANEISLDSVLFVGQQLTIP